MFFKLKDKKPINYREMSFHLDGGGVTIVAGLARPDFHQDPVETMSYLRSRRVGTIFGLDSSPRFFTLASQFEMAYVDASIPDFTAPSIELFDKVHQGMIEQARHGRIIAVHCRQGLGRTGTVLAALKLREMSHSESFLESGTKSDCMVQVYDSPVKCTQNVRDAVIAVRAFDGCGGAVEVKDQIDCLSLYEEHLLSNLSLSSRLTV